MERGALAPIHELFPERSTEKRPPLDVDRLAEHLRSGAFDAARQELEAKVANGEASAEEIELYESRKHLFQLVDRYRSAAATGMLDAYVIFMKTQDDALVPLELAIIEAVRLSQSKPETQKKAA